MEVYLRITFKMHQDTKNLHKRTSGSPKLNQATIVSESQTGTDTRPELENLKSHQFILFQIFSEGLEFIALKNRKN